MDAHLTELGLGNYEFFPAQRMNAPAVGCAIAHTKLLHGKPSTPFLVLEDDVTFTGEFDPSMRIPNDADAVYLGRSRFGIVPSISPWGMPRASVFVGYDKDYYRIYNMLTAHAVLYLNEGYRKSIYKACLDHLFNRDYLLVADIAMANSQKNHLVLTPRKQICYQDDAYGGDQLSTQFEIEETHVRAEGVAEIDFNDIKYLIDINNR